MNFRIADKIRTDNFSSRINSQRGRLNTLQEQLTTGKRINRPSDDPSGAGLVLNLRTTQAEITQFQRNTQTANEKLVAADDALNSYQNVLDRVRTLVTQGLSDTATQPAKNALAIEIDALRDRILHVANTKNSDEYLFGGTRQDAPPFDSTTAAAAAGATIAQYIQIEPGANAIAVGVTADTVFSDATSSIYADLADAAAALRGTGDETVDRAMLENTAARLGKYSDLSNNARAIIGANMNATEITRDNLSTSFLTLDEKAHDIEGVDFASAALAAADAQRSLDATLQVIASGRRSLFDFLD